MWSPWMRQSSSVIWLDGFDFEGGGGGGDGQEAGGGPKEKTIGQVVPQPVNIPVPEKPAPVQEATVKEKAWEVDDVKEPPKVIKETPTQKTVPIKVGEQTQDQKTNIIRKGVKEGTVAGSGDFDYGKGMGKGMGEGPGIGIGFGPGSGPGSGFGFGSYVGILRNRIWSEWVQSRIYGTTKECVVGLTVAKNGNVTDIEVEKASGDAFYDNLARRAVRNASPLPPLPPGFTSSSQRFRIKFVIAE